MQIYIIYAYFSVNGLARAYVCLGQKREGRRALLAKGKWWTWFRVLDYQYRSEFDLQQGKIWRNLQIIGRPRQQCAWQHLHAKVGCAVLNGAGADIFYCKIPTHGTPFWGLHFVKSRSIKRNQKKYTLQHSLAIYLPSAMGKSSR